MVSYSIDNTELAEIVDIAYEAGKIVREASGDLHTVEKSSIHDLVTEYDVKVQNYIYDRLSKAFPKASYMAEEGLSIDSTESNGKFIIDPIDGTTNFIKGLNVSVVSIGYLEDNKPKYGVICNPYEDWVFYAEKGKGAYLNGERIHVSDDPMSRSAIMFGTCPYDPQYQDLTFEICKKVITRCIDLRRYGAAAFDCTLVASGRAGLYYEFMTKPWDHAAGDIIAEEAGAVVTDINGDPIQYDHPTSIIVANPECYKEFRKILDEELKVARID